jgi:hypothetical protein
MADLSTNIEFTFIESPDRSEDTPENQEWWPRVMVDISGVDSIIQPLVLHMFQLIHAESIKRGARYTFSIR